MEVIVRVLHNSSGHLKAEFKNCFIIFIQNNSYFENEQ